MQQAHEGRTEREFSMATHGPTLPQSRDPQMEAPEYEYFAYRLEARHHLSSRV